MGYLGESVDRAFKGLCKGIRRQLGDVGDIITDGVDFIDCYSLTRLNIAILARRLG